MTLLPTLTASPGAVELARTVPEFPYIHHFKTGINKMSDVASGDFPPAGRSCAGFLGSAFRQDVFYSPLLS